MRRRSRNEDLAKQAERCRASQILRLVGTGSLIPLPIPSVTSQTKLPIIHELSRNLHKRV